jgi:transcription-repair coupling factor (superfamily II helicase)
VRKIIETNTFCSDPALQAFLDRICRGETSTTVTGLSGSAQSFILSFLAKRIKKSILVISPGMEEARNTFQDFSFFLGEENVVFFPPWDVVPPDMLSSQRDVTVKRIETLFRLFMKQPAVVVAPVKAISQKVIPVSVLAEYVETIAIGDLLERDRLVTKLIEGGYRRVPLVEEKNEFSVRGHIIDIYPSMARKPLRMEFIGDDVESIKEFDPVTQRSKTELLEFVISPASEIIFSEDAQKRALKNVRNRANHLGLSRAKKDRLLDVIEQGLISSVNPHLLSLFYGTFSPDGDLPGTDGLDTFFDYVSKNSILVFDDFDAIEQGEEEIANVIDRYALKAQDDGTFYLDKESFYVPIRDLIEQYNDRQRVYIEGLFRSTTSGVREDSISFDVESHVGLKQDKAAFVRKENGLLSPLANRIKEWTDEDNLVFFLCSEGEVQRMSHLLEGYSLSAVQAGMSFFSELDGHDGRGRLILMAGKTKEGFSYPSLGLVVISEEEIFGRKIPRKRKAYAREGFFLKSFGELTEGDFVVHGDHGIGLYRGLEKLAIQSIENDFLIVEYDGGDKLYIPVDRLDHIQRYIGPEGYAPSMDRLGGTSWETVKKKIKKSVRAIAKELVAVYAAREVLTGHDFSPPDRYYEEFSSSFEFEETPDQAHAIDDVNFDMNDSRPMDRLICGDAGFGKTEVAVRASFRAAMDGKQVAVLVPTTILAEQHYQTFAKRFEKYPVRVEVLNRYRTRTQQKKIVEDANKGLVDILVGTQRMLQKDVLFKNLGLVIIDEEQRFGVGDKEKLKKLRNLVDVLTLTATPIPRTLQLSLVGIRDLSVIDTPPNDRQFIKVYVTEFDDDVIKEAIEHELARGGQVFFVHDRVRSIYSMARFIERLIPDAKIGVAHGQMKSRDLELVMVKFLKKEYNLLLCTTIIGSGIDVPTANTIVINRADRFGLSQLYQLKGRVGRSKEDAYACLLVPRGMMLSRDAQKRLRIIQEFSDHGSGFKVATHDLEIRGGGNFLGVSQSGHVSAVGFELYTELMEKAVAEIKGDTVVVDDIRPEINFGLSAFISDDYIADEHRRLVTYKKISLAHTDEELSDMKEELIDCYGTTPTEVDTLFELIRVRNQLKEIMVKKMEYDGKNMVMVFHQNSPVDPERIISLVKSRQYEGSKLTPDLRLFLPMPGLKKKDIIAKAKDLLKAFLA